MGRKRHTPEQIITAVRDEGEPGARRLKERERENGRLKRAVADLTLDKLMLEEAAEGNF